jgi:hypothetical protein
MSKTQAADFDAVHTSLKKAGFNETQQYNALKVLVADGLVTSSGNSDGNVVHAARHLTPISPMQAMRKTELHPMLKHIEGQCRRHGFPIDFASSEPIDTFALDRALKASDADTETRIGIKDLMFRAGLIPA